MATAAFILLCIAVITVASPSPRWVPILFAVLALLLSVAPQVFH